MNAIMLLRLQVTVLFSLLAFPIMADEISEQFAKRTLTNSDGQTLNYRLHVPDTKPSEEKLPLVLFLHGAGERGDDNEAQLKHGAREFLRNGRSQRFPAIVVAPQCPAGQRWVETNWGLKSGNGSFPDAPSDSMKLVFQLVDELIKGQNVDVSRLYVTGLSMGGYGSWYAAATYLTRQGGGFAAMLAICGGGDPTWADRYAATDLWGVHGADDPVVPVVRTREMVAAIAGAGHPGDLRYTEYPGVQHDSWTQTYTADETYRWLFGQSRPAKQ
jgi:predicted peptidase